MPNGRQGDGSPEERGRLLSADSDDTSKGERAPEVTWRRRQTYERVSTVSSELVDADDDIDDDVTPVTAPEGDAPSIDRESKPEAEPHTATGECLAASGRPVARPSDDSASQRSSVDRGRHSASRVKVVYYQNRFVTVNIDPRSESGAREYSSQSGLRAERPTAAPNSPTTSSTEPSPGPGALAAARNSPTGVSTVSTIRPQTRHAAQGCSADDTGHRQDQRNTDGGQGDQVTASSATGGRDAPQDAADMQPVPGTSSMGDPLAPMGSLSAIPGVMTLGTPAPTPQVPSKKVKRKKKDSIFTKIARVLEDDRVKRGDKDMGMKLRSVNRLQDASELQILKKILNIIFLITGAALLLGVIVVIVYTAVCDYPPDLEIKDYVEYYHIPEMPTDVHVVSIDEEDGADPDEDFVKPISKIPPEEGATEHREEWPIFESVDPEVDYDDPVDPTPDRGADSDPDDDDDPQDPEDPDKDYTFFEPKKPPDLYNGDGYT